MIVIIMKRFSLIGLLFLTSVLQAAQQLAIIAITADGDEHTYALSEVQNITFSSGALTFADYKMVVNKKDATSQSDVRCLKFGTTTAIQRVENNGDFLYIFPNPVSDYLQVAGVENNAEIRIINMQGKIVRKSNESRIEVSTLLPGAYLLEVDGKTLKFVKK